MFSVPWDLYHETLAPHFLSSLKDDVRVNQDVVIIVVDVVITTWLAGDVKEPTHLSERLGDEMLGVVVWPCFTGWCFT